MPASLCVPPPALLPCLGASPRTAAPSPPPPHAAHVCVCFLPLLLLLVGRRGSQLTLLTQTAHQAVPSHRAAPKGKGDARRCGAAAQGAAAPYATRTLAALDADADDALGLREFRAWLSEARSARGKLLHALSIHHTTRGPSDSQESVAPHSPRRSRKPRVDSS